MTSISFALQFHFSSLMTQNETDATIFTVSTVSSEKYQWIFRVHYSLPSSEGHSQRLTMSPRPLGKSKCCKRYTKFTFHMEEKEEPVVEGSGSDAAPEDAKQNEEMFDLMGVITPAYINYLK